MPEKLASVILLLIFPAIVLVLLVVLLVDRRRERRRPIERAFYALQEPTLCNAVFINGDDIRRCVLLIDGRGKHAGEHVYGIDPRLRAKDFRLLSPHHEIRNNHPDPARQSGPGAPRARQEWPSE